jgi:hypothetical protein
MMDSFHTLEVLLAPEGSEQLKRRAGRQLKKHLKGVTARSHERALVVILANRNAFRCRPCITVAYRSAFGVWRLITFSLFYYLVKS